MALTVYNTATRAKEPFVPLDPEGKRVKIYVCGVTVYDQVHVGHARCYVAFDVIRRYLEWAGYRVTYVQNFTDIDDKIIARARELGEPTAAVADRYIKEYLADMEALNVRRADTYPKATDHIEQMVTLVEDLVQKGYAYVVEPAEGALDEARDVYFSIQRAADRFGTLTNQSLEEMQAGARVEMDPRKRHPADFALWKGAKPGEPSWQSPWGPGRPGWHIECSAMSLAHLGTQFDLHGGGRDLIFPHHESEILQSECHTGLTPVVKYWLHNGFVKVDNEKMSKSLGNFFTLKDILARYDPMVVRFFLLNTHYRSPIDFSDSHLEEAKTAYERLATTRRRLTEALAKSEAEEETIGEASHSLLEATEQARSQFKEAMEDDFNTREALAALFELSRIANRVLETQTSRSTLKDTLNTLEELGGRVLGLFAQVHSPSDENGPWRGLAGGLVEYLLELRDEARAHKDWAAADAIRARLTELGVTVEDTAEGPTWRLN